MSTLLAPRSLFLAMALASAGLMAFALYLEYVYLLDPCPLCMMQRIWVVIVGVLALGAALHRALRAGPLRRGGQRSSAAAFPSASFGFKAFPRMRCPPAARASITCSRSSP